MSQNCRPFAQLDRFATIRQKSKLDVEGLIDVDHGHARHDDIQRLVTACQRDRLRGDGGRGDAIDNIQFQLSTD